MGMDSAILSQEALLKQIWAMGLEKSAIFFFFTFI